MIGGLGQDKGLWKNGRREGPRCANTVTSGWTVVACNACGRRQDHGPVLKAWGWPGLGAKQRLNCNFHLE